MSTNFGDDAALLLVVDVGQQRQAELLAQIGKDRQRRVEPGPALAGQRGAVRLVEAGLVDEADAEPGGHFLERAGHVEGVLARFQLARAGDQRERRGIGEGDLADPDGDVWLAHLETSNAKTAPCPAAGGTTRRPLRADMGDAGGI